MPDFRYKSLTHSGESRSGMVAAADKAEAVRLLTARGETATNLRALGADGEARPAAAAFGGLGAGASVTAAKAWLPRLTARATRPVPRRAEVANLIRELATALEAGLPLMQSLRTVRRQGGS